jgi:hypothetical protein
LSQRLDFSECQPQNPSRCFRLLRRFLTLSRTETESRCCSNWLSGKFGFSWTFATDHWWLEE